MGQIMAAIVSRNGLCGHLPVDIPGILAQN